MSFKPRWNKNSIIFGAAAAWGLLLIGCVAVNRTVLAPPTIPESHYVGTKKCADCHEDQTQHFYNATHANLALKDPKVGDISCEACHGAGSIHVKAGGGKGTIINPGKSPETCFQCHVDKRGEFALPNAHPVLSGQVTCNDCHDPHRGRVVSRTGASLETPNETCTKCHTAQKGPFLFKHNAMEEGCTICHSPHGSVNQKMLVARDANLCLRCHL
ncbi:MAG TPA: cytochrome c3 family protein, partial [Candidatus Didemnitutus sp.]|nr:cytochrome c3 family protein [Candidatus Didemnitutus sp.]